MRVLVLVCLGCVIIGGCSDLPRSYKEFVYEQNYCFISTDVNYTRPAKLYFVTYPLDFPIDQLEKVIVKVYSWRDAENEEAIWTASHEISPGDFTRIDLNSKAWLNVNGLIANQERGKCDIENKSNVTPSRKRKIVYEGYELLVPKMLANKENPEPQETFPRGKQKICVTFIFADRESLCVNDIPFWSNTFYRP